MSVNPTRYYRALGRRKARHGGELGGLKVGLGSKL
jgi:hypothetical protein